MLIILIAANLAVFHVNALLSSDYTCGDLCRTRETCLQNCVHRPGDAPEIRPPQEGLKYCCNAMCGLGNTECLLHCTPYGKRRCTMGEVHSKSYCYSNGDYNCFPCPSTYRCTLDNTYQTGTCQNLKPQSQPY